VKEHADPSRRDLDHDLVAILDERDGPALGR